MRLSLVAALLASVAVSQVANAADITLAHGENPGNPRYLAAERFAELVEQCTESGITVTVAPSATMGDDVEMLTSTVAGVINITANSQGAFAQIVPEAGAIGLPFLFDDVQTAWEVLDGQAGELLDARAQENGLKLLAMWDNGIRHISHVSKAVPTPADLQGMQIRTPPDEMSIAIFEALGASPAPLAFSELPSALQSGVFDGQENPLTNIYSAGLHNITPYITLTGHQYQSTPVVAGLGWWESLDAASQECVQGAAQDAGAYQRDLSFEANNSLQATMEEEGTTFTEVEDRQAFVDATASVYDTYAERFPNFVPALLEAAER
ncbi:TRAP transporter substrate-binding protein [Pelagibacterium sp. H642]|uniref:TRAP transporter substrate-binding protein n=1 Tax=Pelagibacterium sp. H642 TaxID=1881069 RepID=UPI002814A139|nr:TRAP transporter substrate-binding protein [Pelagibacterium sp. H642]WMT91881.1 TRAP transporter substrate-binding protein [Pelagibacterium sp. H642]